MRIVDLIDKKKHGEVLSKDEINFFINSLMDETAPDYQLSYMASSTLYTNFLNSFACFINSSLGEMC